MKFLILIGVYSLFISVLIILATGTVKKRYAILNFIVSIIGIIADIIVVINGLFSEEVKLYTILFVFGLGMFILAIARLFNKNEIVEMTLMPNTYSIELERSIERVLHYLVVEDKKILLNQNIFDTNLKLQVFYTKTPKGDIATKVTILEGKSLFYRFVEISAVVALLLAPLVFYYDYSIGLIPMDASDEGTSLCILLFLYSFFAFGKLSFFTKINKKDYMYTFVWWIMNIVYFLMLFLVLFNVAAVLTS